ncbi:LOW QUALITY PROTEIN: TTLL10 isoform 3, partial [Pan troglodytes]
NRYINDTFWKARGLAKDWVFTTLTCLTQDRSCTSLLILAVNL